MRFTFRNSLTWLAIGLLVALTSGCATPALWHATAARDWRPYSLDQVLLLTDTNHQQDLAVLFSQARGTGTNTITRTVGWRVSQPPDQLAVTSAAIRRLTNAVSNVQPIPILLSDAVPNAADQSPHNIVRSVTPDQFTVYLTGFPPRPYSLPATRQTYYTVRTCILPITVAADAALILLVAGGSVHWN